MSVIINGIDMPKSCYDCPMCYDLMECVVGSPYIGFSRKELKAEPFDFCNERHPRCPLVPVPPHGDLIERKVVNLTDFEIVLCDGDYKEGLKMLLEKAASAPVIIPAEEGR